MKDPRQDDRDEDWPRRNNQSANAYTGKRDCSGRSFRLHRVDKCAARDLAEEAYRSAYGENKADIGLGPFLCNSDTPTRTHRTRFECHRERM
jgi:hypothetical protein